jgi:hypothetical protein
MQLSSTLIVSNAPLAEKLPGAYVQVATVESVSAHDPGVAPKSEVGVKAQLTESLAVSVVTLADVQLSAATIVSGTLSWSTSVYEPPT